MNTRPYLRATCLLMLCAASALAQNRTFTSQYSFGDSLSDTGNLFALTLRTQPPPPYFNGRFSNGPVFVELLGNPIATASTAPTRRGNLNFATGGATAGPGSPVPNLGNQVSLFQQQSAPVQPTDLFTVLAGANDLIAVLSAPTTPTNPAALDVAGANAARAVATNVRALVGLGARNVVVAGLPNLGATPRSLASGGPGGAGAAFGLRASNAFNNELRAQLGPIATGTADLNLVYVDLQGILDRVILDSRALGFNNATSFFLAPSALGGGVGDPNGYVFWDDIHPTAHTHALLAAIILEELNPEPVLGFSATLGSAALALENLAASNVQSRLVQLAASTRATGRGDAFVAFNYGDGMRGEDGWRPKFGYTAQVGTAGADFRVSDGFFAGGALDVGRLNTSVRGGRGNFTVEDATGRLYGLWRGGPISLAIEGDYGVLRAKGIHRTTAFGGFQTNAKTSGTHWGAGARAFWSIDAAGFALRPWLGLRTERAKFDSYSEADVASLNMAFDGQEAKSTAGSLGVDASMNWKLGGRDARLDFGAAWRGEFGSRRRAVSGRLADNFTRPTTIDTEDGDGSGVEIGGALTCFFTKKWSGTLGYAADIRSGDKLANRVTLSLQTGF
ncbi:MAG TPA: autotransporter domain-containing protein [Opitutaceae bacterium]|nr:autotransporter domain-containing protein [Opitutaceae bacterium]